MSEVFLMKKQILLSIDFLLALLATLTWTVPKTFFNVFPKGVTRPGIYFTVVMLLLTWTVLSKNKTSFDDVGV
ncbi:phosphatidate cytidylyltransferase, partial [Lactobacillus mulieris]|nr:phosphatidate cytidylyltransferase [Lactobacillus mulieris]